MSELCRLCASSTSELINLFGEEAATIDIVYKIHTHLPIQVTKEDLLPQTVCLDCWDKLEMCHEFVLKCLKADSDLKTLLGLPENSEQYSSEQDGTCHTETLQSKSFPEDLCEYIVPKPTRSERNNSDLLHGEVSSSISVIDPNISSDISVAVDKSDKTIQGEKDQKFKVFVIKSKNSNELSSKDILRILKTREDVELDNTNVIMKSASEKESVRNIDNCTEKVLETCDVANTSGILHHSENGNIFQCVYCSKTVVGDDNLLSHQTSVHPDKVFVCTLCDPNVIIYESKQTFENHLSLYHPKSKISEQKTVEEPVSLENEVATPSVLPSTLSSDAERLNYSLEYTRSNTLQDTSVEKVSDSISTSTATLQDIVKNVRNGDVNDSYVQNSGLEITNIFKVHVAPRERINGNRKAKARLKMSKDFNNVSKNVQSAVVKTLKKMVIKSKSKKNSIKATNKLVKSIKRKLNSSAVRKRKELKKNLINEAHNSNTEKFKCEICSREFNSKPSFKNHMDIHNSSTSYTCKTCGKIYNTKICLQYHKNYCNHLKEIYVCDICGKTIKHQAAFTKHRISHSNPESLKRFPCEFCGKSFRSRYQHLICKAVSGNVTPVRDRSVLHEKINDEQNNMLGNIMNLCKVEILEVGEMQVFFPAKENIDDKEYEPNVRNFDLENSQRILTEVNCQQKFTKEIIASSIETIKQEENSVIGVSCNICNNSFINLKQLKTHLKYHGDKLLTEKRKRYFCEVCKRGFQFKSELLRHVEVHSKPRRIATLLSDKPKRYSCGVCQRSCQFKSEFLRHVETHNKPRKVAPPKGTVFTCDVCGKRYGTKTNLITHLTCHGEKFTCHICGNRFSYSGFRYHMKYAHSNDKNYHCDVCDKKFINKHNLIDHMSIHTGEKPFMCPTCGKLFRNDTALYIHKRSHSDIFPFPCSICGKAFRTQQQLSLHNMTHSGDKPCPCDICGKGFRTAYEVRRHRVMHFGNRPFVCPKCNRAFKHRRNLKQHDKTHQNEHFKM